MTVLGAPELCGGKAVVCSEAGAENSTEHLLAQVCRIKLPGLLNKQDRSKPEKGSKQEELEHKQNNTAVGE